MQHLLAHGKGDMNNLLLSLTKKFVSIPSTFDNPQALRKVLEIALAELKGFTIERFEKNGMQSALIYAAKKRPKKFRVILNAHLDVVPGKNPLRIVGKKLYGVGVLDMKSGAACLIAAFKDVARKVDYPLALQLVTDEEIGGFNGTLQQINEGVRADFVIAGEPTNFDIVYKAKGILQLDISAKGKTAHGAYPWRGDNAIWKMHKFLDDLRQKFPVPKKEGWVTTLNLSKIGSSNQSFNKIPDDCAVGIDIRYIPGDAPRVLKLIRKLLPKDFLLKIITNEPAMDTDAGHERTHLLREVAGVATKKKIILRGANGSSDARHFARVSCPGIEFGPIGGDIGGDREWVDIRSLERYRKMLKEFLFSI